MLKNVASNASANGAAGKAHFVRTLQRHDHACLLYDRPSEVLAAAGAFLQAGYSLDEQCLYTAEDQAVGEARRALAGAGIPVPEAEEQGRLSVLAKHQSYLRTGGFDPAEMLYFLEDAIKSQNGRALRCAGEMSWALGSDLYVPKVIQYEARLNTLAQRLPFTALCFYDRARFPSAVLNEIVRVHPLVLFDHRVLRNNFYVAPELYLNGRKDEAILERTLEALLAQRRLDPDPGGDSGRAVGLSDLARTK